MEQLYIASIEGWAHAAMDLFAESERANFGEMRSFASPTDQPTTIIIIQRASPRVSQSAVFPRRSYQSVFSPKTKPTQEEGGEWAVKAVGRDPLGIGRASRK